MKNIPVIIIGAGGVGRALLEQIVKGRQNVADRNKMRFDLVAVADSKRWLFDAKGLSDEQILGIVENKKSKTQIGNERPDPVALIDEVHAAVSVPGILVDCTAIDGMEPAIHHAISLGYGIVLANKKALAGPYAESKAFFSHPLVRHESTVGGGQPVIATMRYLLDTGDAPTAVSGQLSGTLGYIAQRLDDGVAFSKAIAEAKAKGFTEPDPREDLSGMDVMRKVMILARMAGWPLEAEQIEVESLYHPSLAHLSVPEFMASAVSMDPSMADRVAAAHEQGMVLRYIAEVEDGKGSVGLKPIPKESPFANLKYISFTTPNYNDEALLLCGKGAGVDMTAAGVHGDMISLGREQALGD